jgi:hypothetical protein
VLGPRARKGEGNMIALQLHLGAKVQEACS